MDGVRYPDVVVKLTGASGNSASIIGRVMSALRRAGVSYGERMRFEDEATAGDYDSLLQTVMRWVATE